MPKNLSQSQLIDQPDKDFPWDKVLENDVLNTEGVQSHAICSTEKAHSYRADGQLNFDVRAATASKNGNVVNQVDDLHVTCLEHDNQSEPRVKGECSFPYKPNRFSSGELLSENHKTRMTLHSQLSSKIYVDPLSESIIYRNYEKYNSLEMDFGHEIPDIDETKQASHTGNDVNIRIPVSGNGNTDEELHQLITVDNIPESVHAPYNAAQDLPQNPDVADNTTEDINSSHLIDPLVSNFINCTNSVNDFCQPGKGGPWSEELTNAVESMPCSDRDPLLHGNTDIDYKDHSHAQVPQNNLSDDIFSKRDDLTLDTRDSLEIIGHYMHPYPVLSVSLASKGDSLQICLLCGLQDSDIRNLFIYIVPIRGCDRGCPSFLGYTSLVLPVKDPCSLDVGY